MLSVSPRATLSVPISSLVSSNSSEPRRVYLQISSIEDAYVPVLKLKLDGIELDLVFTKLPIAAQVRDNLNLDDSFHVAPRPTRNACEADGTGVVLPTKSSESFLTIRTIFGLRLELYDCMGKTGKAPDAGSAQAEKFVFNIPAMPKRTLRFWLDRPY
ncbi:unnamed protein product [Notodromas monacha]|uniref:Poly(A) polymerase nucleotidyltransferase domain-containing protein n=1 Tax=Notodromas monacha TaxID=399045 RepID=A0A7R9GJC9_9CRUS|nr:unnamed protein product [Notodromas monacha]CAG0922719.1 unnamed protein product [Notodromas monacha]